jgi:hypothetical protein
MAIEQFVKHVEGLQHHHAKAKSLGKTQHANIAHLSTDLVKLKDMLKQALVQQSINRR